MLCYPERLTVSLKITAAAVQLSGNSSTVTYVTSESLQEALEHLNATMQKPLTTYIGGIPGRSRDDSILILEFALISPIVSAR